jgi:hypothetical protein
LNIQASPIVDSFTPTVSDVMGSVSMPTVAGMGSDSLSPDGEDGQLPSQNSAYGLAQAGQSQLSTLNPDLGLNDGDALSTDLPVSVQRSGALQFQGPYQPFSMEDLFAQSNLADANLDVVDGVNIASTDTPVESQKYGLTQQDTNDAENLYQNYPLGINELWSAISAGDNSAVSLLQSGLGLTADGNMGPKTISAVNQYFSNLSNYGTPAGYDGVSSLSGQEFLDWRQPIFSAYGASAYGSDIGWQVGYTPSELSLSSSQVASNLDSLQPYVNDAVTNYPSVPKDLLNALIVEESGGNLNATSKTGAFGVLQLTSWIYDAPSYGSPINPFSPSDAINRAAEYLNTLFNDPTIGASQDYVVAAYNQGQGVTKFAVSQGSDWTDYLGYRENTASGQWYSTPSTEGQNYVRNVNQILSGARNIPGYFGTPSQ